MTAAIEERAHALLSPSSAHAWIECRASIAASVGQPEISEGYSGDGSASHQLANWCLSEGKDAYAYAGRVIEIDGESFDVDDERMDFVQAFVDAVRLRLEEYRLTSATTTLLVEQRLSIEHITGEKGAKGTADVVIIAVWTDKPAILDVWDLKYRWGREVSAVKNYQTMIYAAAAYEQHSFAIDFDRVRMTIFQIPSAPSEWETSVTELVEWVTQKAKPAAEQAMLFFESVDFVSLAAADYNPGEKQCWYCPARAVCPAVLEYVENTTRTDVTELTEENAPSPEMLDNDALGRVYPALGLIERWVDAVKARVHYELLQGNAVPGTKLVQGRKGHRKWLSTDEAEALLKSMRLKAGQMYNFKVISPTQADKLLSKESPRRWKKVEALITQPNGSPSVAPESDKRPALVIAPVADDFEVVTVWNPETVDVTIRETVDAGDDLL